jgi:hypothetical protein
MKTLVFISFLVSLVLILIASITTICVITLEFVWGINCPVILFQLSATAFILCIPTAIILRKHKYIENL